MALHLYRRHTAACGHTSQAYRRCQCPIYVKGSLGRGNGGGPVRASLNLTDWGAAQRLIAKWVEAGRVGADDDQTLHAAVDSFLADAADRHLNPSTIAKYTLLLGRLKDYCGNELLERITLDDLSKFRATWPGNALVKQKHQERLKAFFRFAHKRGWVKTPPADDLSVIKVKHAPTLPYSPEEFERLIAACDKFPERDRARVKALILVLRWSGLRVQDAVKLTRERIADGRLFLYTQKTGTAVHIPLPQSCLDAVNGLLAFDHEYLFWSGTAIVSALSNWRRTLRRLGELATPVVPKVRAHRFRDTFAVELLMKGVELSDVSILLGHSSVKVTERSYAPWVARRQSRLDAAVRAVWAADAPASPAPASADTRAPQPAAESATPIPA